MVTSQRQLDRKSSNFVIFAISAGVAMATAALAYQPDLGAAQSTEPSIRIVEPLRMSARCLEADRATVGQIEPLLQRNAPADGPVLERALHTLNVARRHCQYDWEERGLKDYQWLSRWLSAHR